MLLLDTAMTAIDVKNAVFRNDVVFHSGRQVSLSERYALSNQAPVAWAIETVLFSFMVRRRQYAVLSAPTFVFI